jgi:hypothetical protein
MLLSTGFSTDGQLYFDRPDQLTIRDAIQQARDRTPLQVLNAALVEIVGAAMAAQQRVLAQLVIDPEDPEELTDEDLDLLETAQQEAERQVIEATLRAAGHEDVLAEVDLCSVVGLHELRLYDPAVARQMVPQGSFYRSARSAVPAKRILPPHGARHRRAPGRRPLRRRGSRRPSRSSSARGDPGGGEPPGDDEADHHHLAAGGRR